MVQGDPSTARSHQWASLLGEAGDIGCGEFDVVEHGGPADIGELMGPDAGLPAALRPEPKRRSRLAPREGGDTNIETGIGERGSDDGHELPGLGLTEHDLTSAETAGSLEGREESFQTHEVALEFAPLVTGVDQCHLDRDELLSLARREHGEVPGIAGVGWIELDDEWAVGLGGDRRGPALECVGEFAGERGRHVERGAVEASEEGLAGISDGSWIVRGCRNLDTPCRVVTDDIDDLTEHGSRHRRAIDRWRQCSDCTRHRVGDAPEMFGVDQRRRPVDGEGGAVGSATP